MIDNKMNKQTFLYQFLIEPRYRIARHILLLAAVTAVSLNQNIYTFGARIEQLGNQVYLAGLCTLISYFIVGYLHLYLLVPKLLLKKKYLAYNPLLFRVRLIAHFTTICTGILDIHLIRYSSRQRFLP